MTRNYTAFNSGLVYIDTTQIATSGAAVVRVTLDEYNFLGAFGPTGSDIFFTSGLNSLLSFKRVSYNQADEVAVYEVLIPFVNVDESAPSFLVRYGIDDDFSSGVLANTVSGVSTAAYLANLSGSKCTATSEFRID
jgi:hypothetical protein